MSKAQRIQLLKDNGFNCPEYHTVTKDNLSILHGSGHLSIRSSSSGAKWPDAFELTYDELKLVEEYAEHNEEGKPLTPLHFPFIYTGSEARAAAELILKIGFVPIVCKGISLEMNQMAGVIKAVNGYNPNYYDFIVEAALPTRDKPVGVRNISHGGKIDIRFKLPQAIADLGSVGIFAEIWTQLMRQRRLPWYLEFSYVDRPVGWDNRCLIFWEGHWLQDKVMLERIV